jgi:hypothetical protein
LVAPEYIKGDSGVTPHIGENGNWWIGDEDTGKPSRGEKGDSRFTDEKLFNDLIESDMIPAVYDIDRSILTDEKGNIILRY